MVLGGVSVLAVSRAFSGVSLLMWTSVHTISSDVSNDGDRYAVISSFPVVCLLSHLSIRLEMLASFVVISSVFGYSMVATVIDASVLVEMCPIGMAFPNFPARVLFLVLVDRRISGEFVSGVAFRSILLAAGCLLGDGVLWSRSVSDESEIDVSHSNWIVVGSAFDFFLGLILPCGIDFAGRRCVFGLLLSRAFFWFFDANVDNSLCGPRARRFNVCCIISCVVFGGGFLGLVADFAAVPPCAPMLGVFFPKIRGLALGGVYKRQSPLVPLV